jgi:hypothetical protein
MILSFSCVAAAEDLDPAWVVGKWHGFTGSPIGTNNGAPQITIKSDGTYEGDSSIQRQGLVYYRDGKWNIVGDGITLQHVTNPPNGAAAKVTWTLKRSGDRLEGMGYNERNVGQFPVWLEKDK